VVPAGTATTAAMSTWVTSSASAPAEAVRADWPVRDSGGAYRSLRNEFPAAGMTNQVTTGTASPWGPVRENPTHRDQAGGGAFPWGAIMLAAWFR